MGIPGLTTYINNHSDIFYKDYLMHDTVLLIDGNNLASQIYVSLTVTNSAFGGDYERYKHSVQKFLALLLSCNVLPIVVFDGGYEKRKLKTVVARLRNTIRGVKSFNSVNQMNNVKLFPIFMKEVFKEVTRRLEIPCVQSDLEADSDLVYLSRKFNCPVLSYDSDFILSDVEYIPFYGIHRKGGIQYNGSSSGQALPCKMYRVEELFRHFGGLSKEFLPLLQIILGNDYISHIQFRSFLSELNFRYSSGLKCPVSKRLAVLIKWCRAQKSLDTALSKIITNLESSNKTDAIKLLKLSIVEYQVEESILYPYVMEQIHKFNLDGKLEELQHNSSLRSKEWCEYAGHKSCNSNNSSDTESFSEISQQQRGTGNSEDEHSYKGECSTEEIDDEEENGNSTATEDEVEMVVKEKTSNGSGSHNKYQINGRYLRIAWLVDDFRHANFSNHLANIMNIGNIYLLPLRENIQLESVHEVSFDLLKVIGKLLMVDSNEKPWIRVYTRDFAKMEIVRVRCDGSSLDNMTQLWSIRNIPEFSVALRRQFLLENLKLSNLEENLFNGDLFPEEWNLFIISLMYWCRTSVHVNSYHIKSLILSFIYLNIVQTHCGFFESTSAFNKKYLKKLSTFKTEILIAKIEKNRLKSKRKRKSKRKSKIGQDSVKENESITDSGVIDVNDDSNHLHTNSNTSIINLVNNKTVNVKQLILLYETFFPLSHLDEKLKSNHTFFGKDVIHTFCEYQSLFYFMNMLNSILRFPFHEVDMANVYSGTFLYNVYTKILNKDTCIPVLFEHCNEMLDVYHFIFKFIAEKTESNVFNKSVKKPRRKKKKKRVVENEEGGSETELEEGRSEDEGVVIDSDNIYSILQSVHI